MYSRAIHKLWLNKELYFFFNSRNIFNSSKALDKSSDSSVDQKITVCKKHIPVSKDVISPVEWKEAASVIKRLNWENKCLFGPIQSKSPQKWVYSEKPDSNAIIQHETQIPIIEPCDVKPVFSNHDEIKKSDSRNLKALITFPLLNVSGKPKQYLDHNINEWNILRKKLENICTKKFFFPSVSSILEKTMPHDRVVILNRWKLNMIKQLGDEGFQKYQKELLNKGSSLHDIINSYLTSTPESKLKIKENNLGHWKSLKLILPDIKSVKLLEEPVMHPFLCYKGIVDCFAEYKNHLVVIDWKTSKKLKENIKSTYDNPLQIAAYVGALNFDPKYQYLAKKGLIVVAYEDGSPATVHFINDCMMKEYWSKWLLRVKAFWELKLSEAA